MKQHISDEQLKELSYEQFIHLAELVGDKYTQTTTKERWERSIAKEHLTMYITMVQKTNIGQMIEILEEYSQQFKISKVFDSVTEVFQHWNIYICYMGIDDMTEVHVNGNKLVDALFQALKEVL